MEKMKPGNSNTTSMTFDEKRALDDIKFAAQILSHFNAIVVDGLYGESLGGFGALEKVLAVKDELEGAIGERMNTEAAMRARGITVVADSPHPSPQIGDDPLQRAAPTS